MDFKMTALRDVLTNASDFLWSDSLFLPDDEEWGPDTRVLIWDPNDVDSDEDEVPKIAEENGLFCSIGIQMVQQIVENAKQQLESCTAEQLLQAFLYYYDNDAFIEFS